MTTKARRLMEGLDEVKNNLERLSKEVCIEVPVLGKPGTSITIGVGSSFTLKLPPSDRDINISADHAVMLGRWLIDMFEDDDEQKAPRAMFEGWVNRIFESELRGIENANHVKAVKNLTSDLKQAIEEKGQSELTIAHHLWEAKKARESDHYHSAVALSEEMIAHCRCRG